MSGLTLRSSLPLVLLAAAVACSSRTRSNSAAAPPGPSSRNVVTAEDIERYPGKPIEEILAERVAGVEVVRAADGSLALRIRGATSANSPTEPLYVIDGVPAVSGPTGGLSGINRHEILSVEVLKDPASTATYGVRGANGVIVVKTKRLPPPEP